MATAATHSDKNNKRVVVGKKPTGNKSDKKQLAKRSNSIKKTKGGSPQNDAINLYQKHYTLHPSMHRDDKKRQEEYRLNAAAISSFLDTSVELHSIYEYESSEDSNKWSVNVLRDLMSNTKYGLEFAQRFIRQNPDIVFASVHHSEPLDEWFSPEWSSEQLQKFVNFMQTISYTSNSSHYKIDNKNLKKQFEARYDQPALLNDTFNVFSHPSHLSIIYDDQVSFETSINWAYVVLKFTTVGEEEKYYVIKIFNHGKKTQWVNSVTNAYVDIPFDILMCPMTEMLSPLGKEEIDIHPTHVGFCRDVTPMIIRLLETNDQELEGGATKRIVKSLKKSTSKPTKPKSIKPKPIKSTTSSKPPSSKKLVKK